MEHTDGVDALSVERETAESSGGRTSHETEHTQLELPQALQDLLRRLNGSLGPAVSPVTSFRSDDLSHEQFGDFFRTNGRKGRTRTEVRLKVLAAFGHCKTLKSFRYDMEVSRWKFSATEWEALVIPLQTSAQLEHIWINRLGCFHDEMLVDSYLQKLIGQSHRLRSLEIYSLGAKFASEVAVALGPRVHYELEDLRLAIGNASHLTVVNVAKIISCAPKLQKLTLGHVFYSGFRWRPLHRDARESLITALKGVLHLKELRVDNVEGEMVDILAEVCKGTGLNPVVENLWVKGVQGLRARALPSLIGGNIISIELEMRGHSEVSSYFSVDDLSSDQWHSVGKCFLHARRLSKFKLDVHIYGCYVSENLENALVQLSDASQGSSRLHVTLFIRELGGAEKVSGDGETFTYFHFLQRALNYGYIKELYFSGLNNVGTLPFRSFSESLASNSSVERLTWSSCTSSLADGWKTLFFHLRTNTSVSVLDLTYSDGLNEDNFRDLMDLLQVNFIMREILVGKTKWDSDGKGALIQEALERNEKLRGYFSILQQAKFPFHIAKAM